MTAKIKLNAASGGGSFSLQAPSSSSNNRVITLPDLADGTLLTSQSSISGTITMADQWRLTSNTSVSSATDLTSNLERNDTFFSYIGSGMTESSGIFTFPVTGIYLVRAFFRGYGNGGYRRYMEIGIFGTQDNSNYSPLARSNQGASENGAYATGMCETFFDVTNTSNDKVKFTIDADSGAGLFNGHTSQNHTGMTFIRLGDT